MTVYYAIVEDDPLDNGGNSRVIGGADHSTIEGPDGRERRQTHLGHEAWVFCLPVVWPDSVRGWHSRKLERMGRTYARV